MVHRITLQLDEICYTQDTVSTCFSSHGCLITEVDPDDLPVMDVVMHDGRYHTLNNRTLWVWKHRRNEWDVVVDVVKKTQSFWNKYTTDNDGFSVQLRCNACGEEEYIDTDCDNLRCAPCCGGCSVHETASDCSDKSESSQSSAYDVAGERFSRCAYCHNKAAQDCDYGQCGACCDSSHCSRHGSGY